MQKICIILIYYNKPAKSSNYNRGNLLTRKNEEINRQFNIIVNLAIVELLDQMFKCSATCISKPKHLVWRHD